MRSPASQLILGLSCDSGSKCEPFCKAYPDSHDWPSIGAWNQLNDDLGGRLLQPSPPGAVCHPGHPSYDTRKCDVVQAGWETYDFHLEDPVSVMWDNWSNETCLPDPAYPCTPEGYPAYVVNASSAEHVKIGVDFARENNVRINVKSTGHDFLGRSNAPGSLSIWVHHINTAEYHEGGFELDGSDTVIPGNALTVGGGTDGYAAYLRAGEHGQMVVSGSARSVGIVGHTSAGGHSILSSQYGLGADQVLQMQVVTPGGDILTVNEDQYPDLFWALRGGGGSTFGIVTAITVQTHPSRKMAHMPFHLHVPLRPYFWDVVTYTLGQFPKLGDAGLSGHFLVSANPDILNGTFSTGIHGSVALLGHNTAEIEGLLHTMNETIKSRWPSNDFGLQKESPTLYDSFLDWFTDHYDKGGAGGSVFLTSRLLGRATLEDNAGELAHALKTAAGPDGLIQSYLIAGKGTAEARPRGGSNSVHPAWRNAYLLALTGQAFPPLNKTAQDEAAELITETWQPIRNLTPGGGSYLNEGFKYEPEYQEAFWGENYERLVEIKREVDPLDVLWCHPCVGNERWQEREDGRLCQK